MNRMTIWIRIKLGTDSGPHSFHCSSAWCTGAGAIIHTTEGQDYQIIATTCCGKHIILCSHSSILDQVLTWTVQATKIRISPIQFFVDCSSSVSDKMEQVKFAALSHNFTVKLKSSSILPFSRALVLQRALNGCSSGVVLLHYIIFIMKSYMKHKK